MPRSRLAPVLVLALALGSALPLGAAPVRSADPLPRRGFLGVRLLPLAPADTAALGLAPGTPGLRVDSLIAGSTAGPAGITKGDVLLALGGRPLAAPAAVNQAMFGKRAGDTLSVIWLRKGRTTSRVLKLRPAPPETGEGYAVEYGSVATRAGRLRTIWTRPPTPGRHPGFLLIQGIGTFTVDAPAGLLSGYEDIIRDFTKRGYVTLRVDKPGCGDSEGGPLRDTDFDTQLDGFRQALAALRADPGVDPERIVVFGHSMGGAWGPLLAAETPVRGLAVYGTLCKSWVEYVLENTRRQAALGGSTADQIDRQVKLEAAMDTYLGEGLSASEIGERHPGMKAWIDSTWTGGKYYSGLNSDFLRQLAAKNLGEAWLRFPGQALALWGRGDFLSGESDHELIARIVNAAHPGHGRFRALDMDHAFRPIATQEESFATWGRPGEVSPLIVEALRSWSEEINAPTP